MKLLLDDADLGFEILPPRRIGYFPHEETRLLRRKIEQEDGVMNFYLHGRDFAGGGRSSCVLHCVRGIDQMRSRYIVAVRLPNVDYI